jgi:hypothetical protein
MTTYNVPLGKWKVSVEVAVEFNYTIGNDYRNFISDIDLDKDTNLEDVVHTTIRDNLIENRIWYRGLERILSIKAIRLWGATTKLELDPSDFKDVSVRWLTVYMS